MGSWVVPLWSALTLTLLVFLFIASSRSFVEPLLCTCRSLIVPFSRRGNRILDPDRGDPLPQLELVLVLRALALGCH